MIVVKIELWPHGSPKNKRKLGKILISNDGTGTVQVGNYKVEASHAGIFYGKRKEPFKTGKVRGFNRMLSPYRLLCRALQSLGEV